MILKLLFWNIAKRPLSKHIFNLVEKHNVDVLMLTESKLDPQRLANDLNSSGKSPFLFQPSDRDKIQFFSKTSLGNVVEQYVDDPGSVTIRRLDLRNAVSILIAVLHLPSKMNWSVAAQTMHSVVISEEIRAVEGDVGHDRTIVVGDFNMNPFDPGLTGSHGFNAVSTRREARIRPRTIQGRRFSYFYNPMWSLFGDGTKQTSGTFYHRSPPPDVQAWNIYDQVILRPSIMNSLQSIEILTSDGSAPIANSYGIPMHRQASDHLPIFFKLSF